jgi:hypothetical protein
MDAFDASADHDEVLWVDGAAGPVVRPYAMTRGRTKPDSGRFDLISMIMTIRPITRTDVGLGPEHHEIVARCRQPTSLAELAADLDLPAGTVRVLLGDLHTRSVIETFHPEPASMSDDEILRQVLDGIDRL